MKDRFIGYFAKHKYSSRRRLIICVNPIMSLENHGIYYDWFDVSIPEYYTVNGEELGDKS